MNNSSLNLSESTKSRLSFLKASSLNVSQEICIERARYLTEAYKTNKSDPMILRRAKGLKNTLEKMTIFIEDEQLIAGNQARKLRAAPIFTEYDVDWIINEVEELPKRPVDKFIVNNDIKQELLEICEWWNSKTVKDRCDTTLSSEVKKAYEIGVLSAKGNMTSGDGHIMLDFPKILDIGAKGIIDEAGNELDKLDMTDPSSFNKKVMLESVIIAYQGVINFAKRFSKLAEQLANIESDTKRKKELMKISRNCSRVPEKPASDFYEAIQSVWFIHLISQIESNGHSMSLGRFDQYMYNYYIKDIEKRKISNEEIIELLGCLWIKMFGVTKIRPWAHTRFSAGGPTYQNVTLGGITPDGKDAVNELTFLCLDSVAQTQLPQPNVSARVHKTSSSTYLQKCLEVISLGFGMPALHNDDLMIPSLLARGVSLEDANNYAIVGCIEPIIPGKQGYRSAGMSFTNFTKILEIALNNGCDPRTSVKLHEGNGDLAVFKTFKDVMDAFKQQMEYFVKIRIQGELIIDYAIEELIPEPFCSGLVQDCIKRGKTPKEGGSVYDMVTGPETGIVNTGNSLAAIKKLVFEQNLISGKELKEVLLSNFKKNNGPAIRQLLLNKAPKFGNDDDFVDEICNEVYMIFIKELEKYKTTRYGRGPIGCINYPCTATISGNVPSGKGVGATPDGRFAGEALSEGCSPFHGTDKLGPTAVIKSVSKMPNILITGGNLLNQKLNPDSLKSHDSLGKLEALIRTFFDLNGWHIQFNVVSAETLRSAQKNPHLFTDLVVRVAGYSALFTSLDPDTQNDIIARTEQNI